MQWKADLLYIPPMFFRHTAEPLDIMSNSLLRAPANILNIGRQDG